MARVVRPPCAALCCAVRVTGEPHKYKEMLTVQTFKASIKSLASCFAMGLSASKNRGTTGSCQIATLAKGCSLSSVCLLLVLL